MEKPLHFTFAQISHPGTCGASYLRGWILSIVSLFLARFGVVRVTEKPLHIWRSGLMSRNMWCQLFTKLDSIDHQSFHCEIWGCLCDGEATPRPALRSHVQEHVASFVHNVCIIDDLGSGLLILGGKWCLLDGSLGNGVLATFLTVTL